MSNPSRVARPDGGCGDVDNLTRALTQTHVDHITTTQQQRLFLDREICQNVVDRGLGGRTLISDVYGFKVIGLLRLSASPRVVR